ncbi:sensor histidine kinase [Lachnospiraceae bacterium LCP25S3_G4]
MKSTLYLKFIIVYIAFGFVSLFATATLTSELIENHLVTDVSSSLYKEATLVANNYLPNYFSENLSASDVRAQLNGMKTYLESSVWFVDSSGKMIAYSATNDVPLPPTEIKNFNPAEGGNSQYMLGNYHDYFASDMISVIAPIIQGFSTKGYLMIHKPMDNILISKSHFMSAIYITLLIIYLLSFIILIAVHYLMYVPIRRITEAATQYASGNLDHEIPVYTHDEMGYLSASLNYMSSQLKDMEDYQKKFVANVSHDFRSPLTSIKGYVEAMVDGTIPTEMQEKYLKIILFETERLTDLTRDLLTLNEFDTKELLLLKDKFNLHEVIKNTAATFEGICTPKHISIELLLASKVLEVNADRRKIQQVLYNLLDNAIKFSNPNSTITIETTERGDKVFVSVKDHGIGIPRDSLNKVWERFYKSDLSRGKDKKGTGLGLAIVKEVIQAHNENINVVSTQGVGTEFIFSLSK